MAMTDQGLVNTLLTNLYKTSTATTFTPGTGGTAFAITLPYKLRLTTTTGTNTTNGTELTGTGYTAGGSTLGSVFAGTVSAGQFSNANAVSWSVGSTWATVTACEIWDSSATPVRHLFGALNTSISGAVSGDTVQFAAASITVNASGW